MAFTAHQDEQMVEELHDPQEVVQEKAGQLAEFIRAAKRVVVFTGAGVSTSAGIADYRGPQGVWTLKAKGQEDLIKSADMISAVPTFSHMAIAQLVAQGLAHYVISQNVDGLHRKSGVPKECISELHGNSNIEYCSLCRREYLRDFSVQDASTRGDYNATAHETGRRCLAAGCGGMLHDTIINFGESLPIAEVSKAYANVEQADLVLVLGSSLTVAPASDLPRRVKALGGKVAIVNLQRTKQDANADVRAFCGVDDFMRALTANLKLTVPAFRLRRAAALWRTVAGDACCAALDTADAAPATLFRRCSFSSSSSSALLSTVEGGLEEVILTSKGIGEQGRTVKVLAEFFRHYGEPDVQLELPEDQTLRHFAFSIDPVADEEWAVEISEGGKVPSPDDIIPGKGGAATAGVSQGSSGSGGGGAAAGAACETLDTSGWFAVQPVDDCPHTGTDIFFPDHLHVDMRTPCRTCENVGENMMCLACHQVHCGRHVHQHMLAHHEETGHAIVSGFVDLSFWCYRCDEYIAPKNSSIAPFYAAMHTAKFGVPPPNI